MTPARERLITAKDLILLCQKQGLGLGRGNPNNRLRYFTKIGLIPHAQRKQVGVNAFTEGHYPFYTLQLLEKIQELKKAGKSMAEIAKIMAAEKLKYEVQTTGQTLGQALSLKTPPPAIRFSVFSFKFSVRRSLLMALAIILLLTGILVGLNATPYGKDYLRRLTDYFSQQLADLIKPSLFFPEVAGVKIPEETTLNIRPQVLSENLLANPSFENPLNTVGTDGQGKTKFGQAWRWGYLEMAHKGNFYVSNDSVRSGTLAMKVWDSGTEGAECKMQNAKCKMNLGISQAETNTVNGRYYSFSVFLRSKDLLGHPKLRLGFMGQISKDDPNYTRLAKDEVVASAPVEIAGVSGWTPFTFTYENAALGKYPFLEILDYQGGEIYLDDMSLMEISSESLTAEGSQMDSAFKGSGTEAFVSAGFPGANLFLGAGSIKGDNSANLYPADDSMGSIGLTNKRFATLFGNDANLKNSLKVDGQAEFLNNLKIQGAATVSGNLKIDNAKLILSDSRVGSDLIPAENLKYNLGENTTPLRWLKIWSKDADFSNAVSIGGSLTVQGTTLATTGNIETSGNLTVGGNTILGDSTTDTLTVSGTTTINLPDNTINALDIQQGTNDYVNVDTTNSSEKITLGSTSINPTLVINAPTINSTSTTALNLGAATLDFNGAGIIQYGDGSNFTLRDDGPNNILKLTGTTNLLEFGNATDNNAFTFLGTGAFSVGSRLTVASTGLLTLVNNATIDNTTAGTMTLTVPTIKLVGSTAVDIDSPTLDLSTQATNVDLKNITLNALSFETSLLSLDTQNSRVGIGTTLPANTLTVAGTADITGNLGLGTTSPANKLTVSGNADITGNLGIGTTTPGSKLGVLSNASIGATYGNFAAPTSGLIVEGNVGIGTTNPGAYALQVKGATYLNGSVTLGATTSDSLTVNGYVISNLIPDPGSTYNLGSNTRRWLNLWADTVTATNLSGTVITGMTSSYDWLIGSANATSDTQDITLTFERGVPATNAELRWNSTSKWLSTNTPTFFINPDSGITASGKAALIVNQIQNQDLFTASASATTKLVLTNAGNLGFAGNLGVGTTSPTQTVDIAPASGILTFSNATGVKQILTGGSTNLALMPGGNVGIGTTSPAYKLEVNGTLGVGSTASFTSLVNLAVLNASQGVYTDASKNLTSTVPTSGTLGYWQRNGTNLAPATITDSVGIGTTSPSRTLDVNGNFGVSSTQLDAANNIASIMGSGSANHGQSFTTLVSGSLAYVDVMFLGSPAANSFSIRLGENMDGTLLATSTSISSLGSNWYRINFDSNPSLTAGQMYTIRYAGGATSITVLYTTDSSYAGGRFNGGGLGWSNTDDMSFRTYVSFYFIVNNGNVGIGTTSPATALEIGGSGNLRIGGLTASSGVYTDANKTLSSTPPTSGTLGYWQRNSTYVSPATITDSVGIGTTSPASLLDVAGTTWLRGVSGGTSGLYVNSGGNVGVGTTSPSALFSVGATSQFQVSSLGAVTAVGLNSGSGLIQGTGGLTLTGTTNLNTTGTSATTIGNSTGALTLASGGTSAWTNTSSNLTIQTVTSGTLALDSAGSLTVGNTNATGLTLGRSGVTTTFGSTAWTAIPTISGLITATSGLTANNTVTINSNFLQTTAVNNGFAGNLGIGITAPLNRLDVNGSVAIGSLPTTVLPQSNMLYVSGNVGIGITSPSALLDVNGTAWLRGTGTSGLYVNSSGSVGIGTTSPAYKLEVNGTLGVGSTASFSSLVNLSVLSASSAVYTDASKNLTSTIPTTGTLGYWQRNSTSLSPATLTDSVGLGTTAPGGTLEVAQAVTAASAGTYYQTKLDNTYSGTMNSATPVTSIYGLYNRPNIGIGGTSPQLTNLFVDYVSGNIGVGTTSSVTNLYGLYVDNPTTNTGSTVTNNYGLYVNSQTAGTNNFALYSSGGTNYFGGNVGIGTTSPAYKLEVNGTLGVGSTASFTSLVNLAVLNASQGVYTDASKNLTSTVPTTGTLGYWQRNGTSLAPATITDSVGIGTTSPGEKLDVNGNAKISKIALSDNIDTNYVLKANGDVYLGNYVGIATARDTNYRLIIGGSGNSAYFTNNAIFNANVGIGTTGPAYKLEVNGTLGVGSTASFTSLVNLAVLNASQGVYTDASKNLTSTVPTSGTLGYWQRNGTNLAPATITDSVGIGTTAPTKKLQVAGTIYSNGGATETLSDTGDFLGSAGYWQMRTGTNYRFALDTYNLSSAWQESLTVLRGGNVGIGTTNPGYKLDVQGGNINTSGTYYSGGYASLVNNGTTSSLYSGSTALQVINQAGSSALVYVTNGGNVGIGGTAAATAPVLYAGANGNVGIGTTAPAYKLDIAGNAALQADEPDIVLNDTGTAGYTTLTFQEAGINKFALGKTDTGNFYISPYYGAAWHNEALVMNTTNGNVGIGTTGPGYPLSLAKDGVYTSSTSIPGAQLQIKAASNGMHLLMGTDSTNKFSYIQSAEPGIDNKYLILQPNGGNGNVGIGTTNPGYKLDVNGTLNVPDYTWITGGGKNMIKYSNFGLGTGYSVVQVGQNGANRGLALGVDLTGNASGSFTGNEIVIPNNIAMIAPNAANNSYLGVLRVGSDNKVYLGGANYLTLGTMVLDVAGGNVGIGTTAPANIFHVAKDINPTEGSADYDYMGQIIASGATDPNNRIVLGYDSTTEYGWIQAVKKNSGWKNLLLEPAGGNVGVGVTNNPGQKLDVNGTIRQTGCKTAGTLSANTSGDIICTSDENLKNIYGYYQGGLNALTAINPIRFSYKGEDFVHVGFSAQNVKGVLPEASALQDSGYWSLDTTSVVALTVNAIKEQQLQMDENGNLLATVSGKLEARSTNLETKVSDLDIRISDLDNKYASITAELKNQIALLNLSNQTASSSTSLGNLSDFKSATFSGQLTVLGRTLLTDLGVTGKITNGLLVMDGLEGSLETLALPLKLQASSLGNIEMMGQKIVIDQKGNVTLAEGDLTLAKGKVTAKKYNLDLTEPVTATGSAGSPAIAGASAGKAEIPSGQTELEVKTSSLTPQSMIFVTPENLPVAVSASASAQTSFTIKLEKILSQPLKVSWWVVN